MSGYSERYSLTGENTAGDLLEGLLTLTTLAPASFNGVMTTPIESVLVLENRISGGTTTSQAIEHYVVSSTTVSLIGTTTGEDTLLPDAINQIPRRARIGDSGTLGTFRDNQGTVVTLTWRLASADTNDAKIITVQTLINADGTSTTVSEQEIVINQEGQRQQIGVRILNQTTGLTAELNGIRTDS